MVNLLLKLLLCPGIIFIADVVSPVINYNSAWMIIYTGLFIGVVGYVMDVLLLRKIGAGYSALMDIVAAFLIIYFSGIVIPGTYMSFLGALMASALIGLGEYLVHRLILESRREAPEGV